MTLDELREYFKNDQEAFRTLQERAAQRRDAAVDEEVETLKKERQLLKLQKAGDDQELTELMTVLDTRKEKELRAKIEREKIAGELQAIDRTKLSYVEEDKKRELERLAAEREAIHKKEEDIMNEIGGLHAKIKEREEGFKAEKSGLKQTKGKDQQLKEDLRKRETEYAKERGLKIAELK